MKSIGVRLAFFYALAATTTMACLFGAGYQLLERHLVHGLDLLNASEFNNLSAHLGPDFATLDRLTIDRRIRETTEYASALFYINLQAEDVRDYFRSSNLGDHNIPDIPGKQQYDVDMPGIGELRVSEFVLEPFDVVIATPLGPIHNLMMGYVEVSLVLLVVMLAASLAIGIGLSRYTLRPLRLIKETANRISTDTLSERIPVGEVKDEISDLARLLNDMFDRLEKSFIQIKRFTADASHELKTPISLMRLYAEKLLADGGLTPRQEDAVMVQLEELTHLNRVIEDMLLLSRAEAQAISLDLRCQDPRGFLEYFGYDAIALSEYHGLQFEYVHDGQGTIAFEERWIRQVLLNVVTNAINVSPPGGRIFLRSSLADDLWRVSIEDEGPGLTPDQRDRMFERFVRFGTPKQGGREKGNGLGLSICRSLIVLHHGKIFAESGRNGSGLRVVIEIPNKA